MNIGFLILAVLLFFGLCGMCAWSDIKDRFDEKVPQPLKLLLFMIVVSGIIALLCLAFK